MLNSWKKLNILTLVFEKKNMKIAPVTKISLWKSRIATASLGAKKGAE
jgi:hypothetical protein